MADNVNNSKHSIEQELVNLSDRITITPESASTKNIKAVKRLGVMLHILKNPQGVTEKSINESAHVMSGRNYPTKLQSNHGILLITPTKKLKDQFGCCYSLYQLKNAEQAHKLVDLIILHCKRFGLLCPFDSVMRSLADKFPDLGTSI